MTQSSFPLHVCGVSLLQYKTGCVYILISTKYLTFTYIRIYIFIRTIVKQHNFDVGTVATGTFHTRPYAFLARIFGFESNNGILHYIERVWK